MNNNMNLLTKLHLGPGSDYGQTILNATGTLSGYLVLDNFLGYIEKNKKILSIETIIETLVHDSKLILDNKEDNFKSTKTYLHGIYSKNFNRSILHISTNLFSKQPIKTAYPGHGQFLPDSVIVDSLVVNSKPIYEVKYPILLDGSIGDKSHHSIDLIMKTYHWDSKKLSEISNEEISRIGYNHICLREMIEHRNLINMRPRFGDWDHSLELLLDEIRKKFGYLTLRLDVDKCFKS